MTDQYVRQESSWTSYTCKSPSSQYNAVYNQTCHISLISAIIHVYKGNIICFSLVRVSTFYFSTKVKSFFFSLQWNEKSCILMQTYFHHFYLFYECTVSLSRSRQMAIFFYVLYLETIVDLSDLMHVTWSNLEYEIVCLTIKIMLSKQ